MSRSILAALVIIIGVGLGYWGYHEHKEKQLMMIHAENQYQQAYHELTYDMDELDDKIGTALAMHSRDDMRSQLVDVWRLSTLAHGAVGELPLALLPFNKTNQFLANISQFSYDLVVKRTNDKPLSEKEYHRLQDLYRQSKEVKVGLRQVQKDVMERRLRWLDVETALAQSKQNQDNQIIDGLKLVDMKAGDYTQNFGPESPRNNLTEKHKFNQLSGPVMTKKAAVRRLQDWLGPPRAKLESVAETGKGASEDAYEIELSGKTSGQEINASVSKKGGHVIWFLKHRPIGGIRLSLYDATKKAGAFLKQRGFCHLALTESNQYDHTAVLTFVKMKKSVRIYPASLRVQVALDNGEVLAFDETNYLYNHLAHVNLAPKLTLSDAMGRLNPHIHIQENHLAVFQDETGKNILCYELIATRDQDRDTYRLFINAENGDQEKVELLND